VIAEQVVGNPDVRRLLTIPGIARTTKRIYGHLCPNRSATIVAKLDAYHQADSSDARLPTALPTMRPETRKPVTVQSWAT
jgi:hypothetical protein